MEWQKGSAVQKYVYDWCVKLVDDTIDDFLGRKIEKPFIDPIQISESYHEEVYGYN